MTNISLNGFWNLIERPLMDGAPAYASVAASAASLTAEVPGDVNNDIFRAGKLPDPLVALHFSQYAAWVPERSWWYRREIDVVADAGQFAELHLDGLDVHADIWFNDTFVGHHASAFFPFVADVTRLLKRGEKNRIVVRVTTGREYIANLTKDDFPLLDTVPTEADRGYPHRGMTQRIFLRKPAFSWGWDWSPALPTCGITADCALRFYDVNEIERVTLDAVLNKKSAEVRVGVELQRRTLISTTWGKVCVRLTDEKNVTHEVASETVFIGSGFTRVELQLTIPKPQLWWPNGSGSQHRYKVEAFLDCDGETIALAPLHWGMRTVQMEVKPGVFRFIINGEPIFIQGGNWVPCDHLYGRTTPARLAHLVGEAAEANFNCLRVWGGGRYELDAFFDACDEKGIFVWHDFMSACAPLPYDRPDFAELCRREAVHQMRRLYNHACMMLWCGNNEVGAAYDWHRQKFTAHTDPAWVFYFRELPRIAAAESPLPYWPTSPYGGKERTGDLTVGDDHHWVVMRPDSSFWSNPEYWDAKEISIFNSEYGYGGPCSLASTKEYLGTDSPDLFNDIGREHTNTFYDIPRVNFSIEQHYRDAANLPIREYIRLGGLCQGLNLGYSLESLRANSQTWGGIFWMYNDAWGENGWTIIDYYLRRKISYYNVRRSLAPVKFVLRRGGQGFGGNEDEVLLMLLNSSGKLRRGIVRFGYQRYDGSQADLAHIPYSSHARSNITIATHQIPSAELLAHGTLVVLDDAGDLPSVAWRHNTVRNLQLPPAHPHATRYRIVGDDLLFTVRTDHYAHAISFDIPYDYRLSDCWFDLLPGESRNIRIYGGALLRQPLRVFCVNA